MKGSHYPGGISLPVPKYNSSRVQVKTFTALNCMFDLENHASLIDHLVAVCFFFSFFLNSFLLFNHSHCAVA